jgi:hypothetical protein
MAIFCAALFQIMLLIRGRMVECPLVPREGIRYNGGAGPLAAREKGALQMRQQTEIGSREVARAAILLSLSRSREEENELRGQMSRDGVLTAAADYGGELVSSVMRIVERAVVAAKREGVIGETHHEEGAVAGAAREAISQVTAKALGFSVG